MFSPSCVLHSHDVSVDATIDIRVDVVNDVDGRSSVRDRPSGSGPPLPDVSRTAFRICTGTAALPALIVLNRTPQLPPHQAQGGRASTRLYGPATLPTLRSGGPGRMSTGSALPPWEAARPRRRRRDYRLRALRQLRFQLTASLRLLDALNDTDVEPGLAMLSPVRGFSRRARPSAWLQTCRIRQS